MAIQFTEEVPRRLGLPALEKISPNDQSKNTDGHVLSNPVIQGAVMSALAGLYKLTRNTENCEQFLLKGKTDNWLEMVYPEGLDPLVQAIVPENADNQAKEECKDLIRRTAEMASILLFEQLGNTISATNVKLVMTAQRNDLMLYMPVGMQLGNLLKDSMLEDNTLKMTGPVSSMTHMIENIFSQTD